MHVITAVIDREFVAAVISETCTPGGSVQVTVIDDRQVMISFPPVSSDVGFRIVFTIRGTATTGARITNTWV